jgi:hypothetical protein
MLRKGLRDFVANDVHDPSECAASVEQRHGTANDFNSLRRCRIDGHGMIATRCRRQITGA